MVAADLVPVVSLLGVVGNALNVAVFFRQGLHERVNVCLFSLALADLVVSLFFFLFYVKGVVWQFWVLANMRQYRSSVLSSFVTTYFVGGWRGGGGVCLCSRVRCVCVCVCV